MVPLTLVLVALALDAEDGDDHDDDDDGDGGEGDEEPGLAVEGLLLQVAELKVPLRRGGNLRNNQVFFSIFNRG